MVNLHNLKQATFFSKKIPFLVRNGIAEQFKFYLYSFTNFTEIFPLTLNW